MRIEKRKIEQTVEVYIADDGKEFGQDERACFKYELLLRKHTVIQAAEKLRITNLDGTAPISADGECKTFGTHIWYQIKDRKEFDVLCAAYDESFPVPNSYPEIICVKTSEEEMYASQAEGYLLSSMMDATTKFWDALGFILIYKNRD